MAGTNDAAATPALASSLGFSSPLPACLPARDLPCLQLGCLLATLVYPRPGHGCSSKCLLLPDRSFAQAKAWLVPCLSRYGEGVVAGGGGGQKKDRLGPTPPSLHSRRKGVDEG